jgi:hypothetical protein
MVTQALGVSTNDATCCSQGRIGQQTSRRQRSLSQTHTIDRCSRQEKQRLFSSISQQHEIVESPIRRLLEG